MKSDEQGITRPVKNLLTSSDETLLRATAKERLNGHCMRLRCKCPL